ncbi:MAG: hypothetical protein JXJ04_01045 [Spirochaetales bacterium]|nr:hypothetical protein [Spirochaetales bacterium]
MHIKDYAIQEEKAFGTVDYIKNNVLFIMSNILTKGNTGMYYYQFKFRAPVQKIQLNAIFSNNIFTCVHPITLIKK